MLALTAAHQAADEYFTSRHTAAWDTTFVIPPEALVSDAVLFRQCNMDFPAMCRHKQSLLAKNRLSLDRLHSIFGLDGLRVPGVDPRDFNILCEFAVNGITPPVSSNFQPQSQNIPPLRDRYILLQHPINRLLYKQYTDGTMILLSMLRQFLAFISVPNTTQIQKTSQKEELLEICQGSIIHCTLPLTVPPWIKMPYVLPSACSGVKSNIQQSIN